MAASCGGEVTLVTPAPHRQDALSRLPVCCACLSALSDSHVCLSVGHVCHVCMSGWCRLHVCHTCLFFILFMFVLMSLSHKVITNVCVFMPLFSHLPANPCDVAYQVHSWHEPSYRSIPCNDNSVQQTALRHGWHTTMKPGNQMAWNTKE